MNVGEWAGGCLVASVLITLGIARWLKGLKDAR
jgi:hypothetical protein